ncbi:MAG: MBL fold metallo-hydrolase [Firmicutes bacterium]|nr:MBL fold metallo-hydrolase [Bacillota bacterium]
MTEKYTKWKGPEPRPYYAKYKKLKVKNDCNGWFECYELPGDITAICEPQHLQEVNVFIIKGDGKALMLDTGMGICNIEPLVRELWPGELTIVNCHRHFDHTGNNWRFPEVLVADVPEALKQAETGCPHKPLANQADEDMFLFGYPEGFVPEEYCVKPFKAVPVEDGHVFDLGNREVELIYTPGHLEDHLMIYDRREKILFSGDMIYLGAIYVQFSSDVMGRSDIGQYIESLNKVEAKFPEISAVYTSHNDFIMPPDCIGIIRDALVAVKDGTAQGEPLRDEKYGYFEDPQTMKQYQFEGFSIVYKE